MFAGIEALPESFEVFLLLIFVGGYDPIPGDSKWPALIPPNGGHLTIPKRSPAEWPGRGCNPRRFFTIARVVDQSYFTFFFFNPGEMHHFWLCLPAKNQPDVVKIPYQTTGGWFWPFQPVGHQNLSSRCGAIKTTKLPLPMTDPWDELYIYRKTWIVDFDGK